MDKKRLLVLVTHPIQYYAPLYRTIQRIGRIELLVIHTRPQQASQYEPVFGQEVQWDIPLLEGYNHGFVPTGNKLKQLHAVIGHIRAFRPHAIWIYGWNHFLHAAIMLYRSGKEAIWFRGDSTLLDPQAGFTAQLRKLFLRTIYRLIDKAFYVGASNKAYYEAMGLAAHQLVYAPHAVDNDRFATPVDESTIHAIRSNWQVQSNEIVFLFVGKFEPKKDPLLLTEAFVQADLQGKARLVLVGNGPQKEILEAYATHHAHIQVMPFQNQSQLPAIYQAADVLVLPSKGPGETWGLVANEAMNGACAILLSNRCGSTADLVIEGKTGLSFSATSLPDLVHALQILTNYDLVKSMGQAAKAHIASFSYTAIEEALYQSLEQL